MPNVDGGHYFLTVFAPIKNDELIEHDGILSSPVHMVRDALATLPTARQYKATIHAKQTSPFARNRRNHFARFAVIDDTVYNGRDPTNALKVAIMGINPVAPQPVDQLTCPYLLFAAEFDAAGGGVDELRSYLAELWASMEDELRAVFGFCHGFDRVEDASSFQDYIIRCQIETTMPFNDYWVGTPPLKPIWTSLALGALAAAGAVLAANWATHWPISIWGAIAASLAAALIVAYWIVMAHGRKPLPTAPNSDLPSVLKALYLQQKFIRLASTSQGADNATLHQMFGEFVAEHAPTNLQHPTQAPGVIKS